MNHSSTPDDPAPDDLHRLFPDGAESDADGDPMFDAMLAEILRGEPPTDLRQQILQRLDDTPASAEVEPVDVSVVRPRSGARRASKADRVGSSRFFQSWKMLAAVAAVALAAVGVRWNPARVPNNPVIRSAGGSGEGSESDHRRYSIANSLPSQLASGAESEDGTDRRETETRSGDGSPAALLASGDTVGGAAEGPDAGDKVGSEQISVERLAEDRRGPADDADDMPVVTPVRLASTQLHQQFHTYWDRVGVTPAPVKTDEEIAELVKARLGVKISADDVRSFEAADEAISKTWSVRNLAAHLLATWSMRSVEELDSDADEEMIRQLSRQLRGRKSVAELFVRWMGLPDELPEEHDSRLTPWAELVSPLSPHSRVVATAAVTMDHDLRCARCHDVSGPDSLPRQSDYWHFAAFVDPIVQPQSSTTLRDIQGGESWDDRALSYETLDRQQRLAEPKLPEGWSDPSTIGSADRSASTRLARWTGGLKQSRRLAAGLVSTTWQLVHGSPLSSQSCDFSAAPADPLLEEMHRRLTDDLLASDFDLVRTVALMVTDPAFGRDIPEAMSESQWLLASNEQWRAAATQVNAWAAGTRMETLPPANQRMRLAKSLVPDGRLSGANLRESLLGQTVPGKKPGRAFPDEDGESFAAQLMPAGGFPARATIAAPAWLEQLPTFESQVNHVIHLAGRDEVRSSERELAQRMQDVSTDRALLWQRLWWTIR